MKIYTTVQIGEYHLNHCDDYLFVDQIGHDKIVCAVMDGCTMAADSYFASTLIAKLLRKVCKVIGYDELYHPEKYEINISDYLKLLLGHLFSELRIVKNQLLLERNELLTTLIILVYHKKMDEGVILAIGDGLVSVNGAITEYDQDNKPDYLGFHLDEDFDSWYDSQKQKLSFDQLVDLTIATDGISMFTKVSTIDREIDPIQFLVADNVGVETDEMLNMKLKKLQHEYGLKPGDDLAMIRIIA